jgi:hypothetical protein
LNPINPETREALDREASRGQAERLMRGVLEDAEHTDEIAVMSVTEYAESRHKEIVPNPRRKNVKRRSQQCNIPGRRQGNSNQRGAGGREVEAGGSAGLHQKLEAKNAALQGKLDEIADIIECDDPECTAEEHLAEIQDVIENGNVSNGAR